MIDIALIVIILITGIIAGIIVGALYTVLNIMWTERKAKRDYEQGKRLFELKDTPKKIRQKKQNLKKFPIPISDEEVKARGEELEVPKPLIDTEQPKEKKNLLKWLFKKKKGVRK